MELESQKMSVDKQIKILNSENESLNELLNAQSKGIIKGIYGRMGQLASISGEYDVAIS